jgi:hypothetical protein
VHPRAHRALLLAERERVVEVLRGLGVDREGQQVAQVDTAVGARLGRRVRLERLPRPALDEQCLEDVLDPVPRADARADLGAAAAGDDVDEVARLDVVQALRVEDDRRSGLEVRLALDEPAAPLNLDDQALRL